MAMIETPEAVENADAIAAVDGIDVLHIGASDLSTEMGIPGQYDRPGLSGVLNMRYHDPLSSAIEDAGRIMRVVRGDPGDRRDPHAQCRDAHPGGGFERGRIVLEVDVDRVEPARRRNHRDVRSAQLVDPHAQHQFLGFQHLLGAVLADLRGHRVTPTGSTLPSIARLARARNAPMVR